MDTKTWFKRKLDSFKDDFEFRLETLIYKITEKISEKMDQKRINRTKFAKLLQISPPAVTKILNGNSNFTLKTLLSIADALELDLKIDFKEKQFATEVNICEWKFSELYPCVNVDDVYLAETSAQDKPYSLIKNKPISRPGTAADSSISHSAYEEQIAA